MTSVQNPTYLLAPNWTFLPDGPIALGNIVIDPFRPHRVLSKATDALPVTQKTTEKDWKLATEKIRKINLSIWSTLFDQARLKLAAQNGSAKKIIFTMKSLDTIYFKDEPTLEEITERVKEPRIRNILKPDNLFCSPVYMITGLKVAKEFKLSYEKSSKAGVSVEESGAVVPEASIGAKMEGKAETKLSDGFESGNDIIFAYQLLRIKPKGWGKDKTLDIDEFHNKAAFLGDSDGQEEVEEDVEVVKDAATADVLTTSREGITAWDLDDDLYTWLFKSED